MTEARREQILPGSQFGIDFDRKFDGDETKNENWIELTDPKKLSPYLNLPISVKITEDTFQYIGESTGDEHSLVTKTIEGILVRVDKRGIIILVQDGTIDYYPVGQDQLESGRILSAPFYHHTYHLRNFAQIAQITSLKTADSDLLKHC